MNPQYDRLEQRQAGLVRYLRLQTQRHQNDLSIFQLRSSLAQKRQQVANLHSQRREMLESDAQARASDYAVRLARFRFDRQQQEYTGALRRIRSLKSLEATFQQLNEHLAGPQEECLRADSCKQSSASEDAKHSEFVSQATQIRNSCTEKAATIKRLQHEYKQ